ncbi:enoyl-CoA hydratase/isomerase family protein [Chitinophaga sp. NPDC101104]|uniref:enoyl-CoA hydratase/isomerase family protein n=1 Tax=Chitinophaga sp. NPDC101104 TaxID=3390561 RepID=UPI003D014AAD
MSGITYAVAGRIATITLNRPEKRNALNGEVVHALRKAFAQAEADGQVKVVVLAASGKAFCAGADLDYLRQLQQFDFEENYADSRELMQLFREMYELKKPVIAQIEGDALAGGCGLATVADLSYAVPEARFGYTEVKIGFVPALVSVFLVRKIGEGRARELMLTGALVPAETAERYGLITAVVPADRIAGHVQEMAERLCNEASANSLTVTKQLIANVFDTSLEDGLEAAARTNAETRRHPDCQKGIAAFLDKKKPEW